jgi:hypothetical protein
VEILARLLLAIADTLRALAGMLSSHRPDPAPATAAHPNDADWVPAPPAHWLEHARPQGRPSGSAAPPRATRPRPSAEPPGGLRRDRPHAVEPPTTAARTRPHREQADTAPRRPPSAPVHPSSYHPSVRWPVERTEPARRGNAPLPGSEEGLWPELPTDPSPTRGEQDAIERWLRRARQEREQDEV